MELFSAPPILTRATRVDAAGNPVGGAAAGAASTTISLTYSGPGATAASVEIEPGQVVLGPGGVATVAFKVLDDTGAVIAGVPVSWTSTAAGVATVDGGNVTGVSDGISEVVVTTPTGLQATSTVYVVSGTLAFVQDGVVRTRAPGGGDVAERGGAGAASAPAWSPDGTRLFFAEGGSVRLSGDGSPLFGGGWPSVSPDGTKLAADDGSSVVFANDDGSNAPAGPAGTTPVWSGDGELIVGGGSVQRVMADGSGRSDVAGGSAELPALGPGGAVAYVDGGTLMVTGGGTVATAVDGRPSWSPDGFWLVVQSGGGLVLAPVDGSAAPAALPGLEGASDPAFQPSGALSAPPALSLAGVDPDPPVPGQPVQLLGAGFDWIIPSNNRVFWPTADAHTETAVSAATSGSLTTVMPRTVAAAQIRVETRTGSAVLDFVPTLGAIEVRATTREGIGVPGVEAIVFALADGSEVGRGLTDESGDLLLSGLVPGSHRLDLRQPRGFALKGAASQTLDIGVGALVVDVLLTPLVGRISISPERPRMAVGERVAITVQAFDLNGRPITAFDRTFWGPGNRHIGAGGSGLNGIIAGIFPTDMEDQALFNVGLNAQVFSFQATVTSAISGKIQKIGEHGTEAVKNHRVFLEQGGEEIAATETDSNGLYRFSGLLGGTYTVRPAQPSEKGSISPESRDVTLDENNPTGKADFTLSETGLRTGPIRIVGVGYNGGDEAAHEVVSDGHIEGSVARISHSIFNAMSVADLIATYDVLIITWLTSSLLDFDWDTRARPFLEAGGGIMYEDPNNMSDLAAIVSEPSSCSSSGFQDITVDVPGLTDGVSSATDLGSSSLINNHICFADWADWLSPFLEIPASAGGPYTTGLYGTWGAGRIVFTGPDQDFHAESDGSTSERNQFQLLINVLKWVGRLVG